MTLEKGCLVFICRTWSHNHWPLSTYSSAITLAKRGKSKIEHARVICEMASILPDSTVSTGKDSKDESVKRPKIGEAVNATIMIVSERHLNS